MLRVARARPGRHDQVVSDDSQQLLRATFEQAPELYDRARPNYPPELFDDLAALARLGTLFTPPTNTSTCSTPTQATAHSTAGLANTSSRAFISGSRHALGVRCERRIWRCSTSQNASSRGRMADESATDSVLLARRCAAGVASCGARSERRSHLSSAPASAGCAGTPQS